MFLVVGNGGWLVSCVGGFGMHAFGLFIKEAFGFSLLFWEFGMVVAMVFFENGKVFFFLEFSFFFFIYFYGSWVLVYGLSQLSLLILQIFFSLFYFGNKGLVCMFRFSSIYLYLYVED